MRSMSTARGQTVAAVVAVASAVSLGLPVATSASSGTFVERADAACSAAGRKVEKLPKKQTVGQIDSELAIVSGLLSQLRVLTPPALAAAQFAQFISATKRQVTDVRGALAATKKKQTATVTRDLKATAVAGEESNSLAAAIGLRACAKNYSPEGS
jgi:hypothetical protein